MAGTDGTKRKRGRPAWEPNRAQISSARRIAGTGASWPAIARGISTVGNKLKHDTLEAFVKKYPAHEFSVAVKEGLLDTELELTQATKNDAVRGEKPTDITQRIFMLKCKFGWREKQDIEVSGPGGGPIATTRAPSVQQFLKNVAKARKG